MSRGNRVIITPDRAIPVEGILAGAYLPGTIVQVDASVALQGDRHTWTVFSRDADGDQPRGPFIILTENLLIGKTMADAYATGERAFGAIMLPGCEFNGLLLNLAGTADDHALNEILMIDTGTGKFIATTGSPEDEPAMLLEAVTDPTADTLAWMQWSGV